MTSVEEGAGPKTLGPGLLLGVGLGGFVDGIVLHQILQWHHLLSARPQHDAHANLVADGLFHVAAWLAVAAGVAWLWRRLMRVRQRRPAAALVGPMLAGWGAFNLVEGLVNHHLLGLHHVRPGPHEAAYDVGFLVLGGLLVAIGTLLYRRGAQPADRMAPGTGLRKRAGSSRTA
jgi:uncharacterized membrane protein